ncbi:MAG: hypothetical protein UU72_C0012G0023, partial [candidate division WWE3 bacterium GW2011_GWB1_41_6]
AVLCQHIYKTPSSSDPGRSGFLVKVDNSQGENHFDLVMEGDDPKTSRVGLRPWAYGKPNPSANVIWAQQGNEPRDWLH